MATLSNTATRLATDRKTPYLLIAAAVAVALACSAVDHAALAATPGTSGPADQAAPQGAPPQQPQGQANPSQQSLNDQQNGSKGVITPPPTGDRDIQTTVPNPNAGSPQEVIPAPGSPGGNQNVEPR